MKHYAWLLGLRSVTQNARRNLATALAIGFGYIALILVFGYGTRVRDYFAVSTIYLGQSGHVTVFKKDGKRKRLVRPARYSLNPEDIAALDSALKSRPEFDFSAPYLIGSGLIGNGCHSFLFSAQGFIPDAEARIQSQDEVKRVVGKLNVLAKGEVLWAVKDKAQVSIGAGLAKKLEKSNVGIAFGAGQKEMIDCSLPAAQRNHSKDASVQILARDYDKRISVVEADITSLFRSGVSGVDDTLVQIPLSLMQELYATDSVSFLSIFLKDKEKAPELAAFLNESLQKSGNPVDAFVWNDVLLNPNYVNGVAILDVSLLFVGIIVLVVVLLSILNTLTIGLAESRREIGTLRAIGYKPLQVAAIFAVESTIVGSVAILIGAGLAKGFAEFLISLQLPFRLPGLLYSTTFQVTPTLENFLQCALLLLLLVISATVWKTRSYAKQGVLTLLDPGG